MARIRTIKPEFWTHEDLSALPEATHMLAAALLNHADDEGYFNANPGLVKAACCPLREPSVSVQDSLNHLVSAGYIRLGTASDGKRYGHVLTFDDHQRVNRPTASKIKALGLVWDASRTTHARLTEDSSPERNREQGKEQGIEPIGSSASADADAPKSDRIPHQAIVDAYNGSLSGLAKVREITPTRKTAIRSAWQASPQRRSLEFWQAYFAECAEDPFLNGAGPYREPHANWRPDFDYLLKPRTVTKVFEAAMSRMEIRA